MNTTSTDLLHAACPQEWLLNRAGSVNMTCTDHKQSLQWVSAFHGMQDNRKKQRLTAEDAAAAGRSNRFARAQQLLHAQLAQQDSIEVTEDIESAGQQEQSAALHARNAAVPAAISPAAGVLISHTLILLDGHCSVASHYGMP